MSTNYYQKGQTPEQLQGLTEITTTSKPRIAVINGHGIGERNNGDQAGLEESSGWPGWGNQKNNAEKYGILQIYINTSDEYQYKEYQFAVDWVIKRYPQLKDNIWVFGHSLGSYGFAKHGATDEALMAKIAGWIDSASGNPGDIAEIYKNLAELGAKWWGVTAINDTVSGTSPIAVTRIYENVKALNPNAQAILTTFPATEWPNDYPATRPTGSKKAHNAVLNRLTAVPMYYSGGNLATITKGIPEGDLKMNLWEWMVSNPRGSVYQPPTLPFTGPKFTEEEPLPGEPATPTTPTTPTEPVAKKIKRVNATGKISATYQYTDNSGSAAFAITQVDIVELLTGKVRITLKNGKEVLKTLELGGVKQ